MLKDADVQKMTSDPFPPPDTEYLLDVDGVRKFPVYGAESLHKVANHIHDNPGCYPYKWRKNIARNLLKKAEQEGESLPHADYWEKAAGEGVGNPSEMANNLRIRADLAENADLKEDLWKYADEIADKEPSREISVKCAELMATFDEKTGSYTRYRRQRGTLETPEEASFHKTASELENEASQVIKLANDEVITEKQLQNAPHGKIAAFIGGEFEKRAMSRLPNQGISRKMAESLPEEGASILCRFLTSDDA